MELIKLCQNYCNQIDDELLKKTIINSKNIIANFQDDNGNTPLIKFCMNKYLNIDILKLMLTMGANKGINIQNNDGATALLSICFFYVGKQPIDANINYVDIFKLMIDYGANVNIKDNSGYYPLEFIIAEFYCNDIIYFDTLKYLLNNNANFNQYGRQFHHHRYSLQYYIFMSKYLSLDVVKLCIEYNVDINMKDLVIGCNIQTKWIYFNQNIKIEDKLEIIKFLKKYINNLENEIKYVHDYNIMNKNDIINELILIDSNTKNALKNSYYLKNN